MLLVVSQEQVVFYSRSNIILEHGYLLFYRKTALLIKYTKRNVTTT